MGPMMQSRPMELSEVVRRRRMVRRYDGGRAVDAGAVDRLLDHAHRAPSAGHAQGVDWLRLEDPDDVSRFWAATSPDPGARNAWLDGMRTAPVVLVALADPTAYVERYAEPDKARAGLGGDPGAWPVPWWHVDAGMAALLVLQTAVDEGLGACFFGVPPARWDAFRAAFGVPADRVPVGAVTVGHRLPGDAGAGRSAARPRRPLDEVVHRGRW